MATHLSGDNKVNTPPNDSLFWQIVHSAGDIAYAAVLAAYAGAVRYVAALKSWDEFRWARLIFSAAVGGLNGYLVYLLCDSIGCSWQSTAFLTGASGALGNEMLIALARRAKAVVIPGDKYGK